MLKYLIWSNFIRHKNIYYHKDMIVLTLSHIPTDKININCVGIYISGSTL